ncbi:MAG: hypothetical protein NVS1B5_14560 [Gemmatimonadaceae bacterium]
MKASIRDKIAPHLLHFWPEQKQREHKRREQRKRYAEQARPVAMVRILSVRETLDQRKKRKVVA